MDQLYVLIGCITCFEGNDIEDILGIFKSNIDCLFFKEAYIKNESNEQYDYYKMHEFESNGLYYKFKE